MHQYRSGMDALLGDYKNFVFIGESGCGKSEIALNVATLLAEKMETHLFDLDQTKVLYRSRDARDQIEDAKVILHYAEQVYDSPTVASGVRANLLRQDCCTVIDVGGNDTGARMIGQFSRAINTSATKVFYIVNPYRPWSRSIIEIDETMSAILGVSHLQKISVIINPNLGPETTKEDFLKGLIRAQEMLSPYVEIQGVCVQENIYDKVKENVEIPLIPIDLHLSYE